MNVAMPALKVEEGASPRIGWRADLEWLRVIALLAVFTIHVAEPFNPWDSWHIVSPARSGGTWGFATAFLVLAAASLSATVASCAVVASSGVLRVFFGLRPRRRPAPG